MDNDTERSGYLNRAAVMQLLSDVEVAQVSNAEDLTQLVPGEEYVDLEHLERGVRRVPAPWSRADALLLRRAVSDRTWRKICALVSGDARSGSGNPNG